MEYFIDHERIDAALFDGLPQVIEGALVADSDAHGHGMALRPEAEQYRTDAR